MHQSRLQAIKSMTDRITVKTKEMRKKYGMNSVKICYTIHDGFKVCGGYSFVYLYKGIILPPTAAAALSLKLIPKLMGQP